MADVISAEVPAARKAAPPGPTIGDRPAFDVIELFFFAYRDFVRDPDEALAEFGFGRAHHRVLHFVDRNPGLTVTELLDILKITKQSLGRVLRELVEKDFIESREGASDRRQRLLYVTEPGDRLARELARLQTRRVSRALSSLDAQEAEAVRRFFFEIIDPEERAKVANLTGAPSPRARG